MLNDYYGDTASFDPRPASQDGTHTNPWEVCNHDRRRPLHSATWSARKDGKALHHLILTRPSRVPVLCGLRLHAHVFHYPVLFHNPPPHAAHHLADTIRFLCRVTLRSSSRLARGGLGVVSYGQVSQSLWHAAVLFSHLSNPLSRVWLYVESV